MKFDSINNKIKNVSIHLLDLMFDTAAFLGVEIQVLSIYSFQRNDICEINPAHNILFICTCRMNLS